MNDIHFFCPSSEPAERRIERSETDGGQSITRLADKLRLENRACSEATVASLHLVPKQDTLSELVPRPGRQGLPCSAGGSQSGLWGCSAEAAAVGVWGLHPTHP